LTIERGRGKGTRLQLIHGSYPYRIRIGSLDVVLSPEKEPPFKVDAVTAEEDTFLVMSADRTVRDPKEPLMKVMTRVINTRPKTPGSVFVQGTTPLRLLAVVHDLNEDPSWKEAWITRALVGIFCEAEIRKLRSIAVPFLGTLHGSLDKERFLVLLRSTIERISLHHLKRLWLVVPDGTPSKILEILDK
jgi:hypothetical protein